MDAPPSIVIRRLVLMRRYLRPKWATWAFPWTTAPDAVLLVVAKSPRPLGHSTSAWPVCPSNVHSAHVSRSTNSARMQSNHLQLHNTLEGLVGGDISADALRYRFPPGW